MVEGPLIIGKLASLTIPVVTLIVSGWLFYQNHSWAGVGIFLAGFAWYGIDQLFKLQRIKENNKAYGLRK